jgi:hypothetical protein
MTSPGQQAIERAKQDGSWNNQQRVIIKPEEIQRFAQMIAANSQSAINFQKMPPSLKKAVRQL